MKIKQSENGKKGRFYIEKDGMELAKMTYSHKDNDKIVIEHTEVDPSLQGQNIGKELVKAAVEFLRAHNLKVIPMCPFANAIFKKNKKEYADVLL